jgi:hypothetical protein
MMPTWFFEEMQRYKMFPWDDLRRFIQDRKLDIEKEWEDFGDLKEVLAWFGGEITDE